MSADVILLMLPKLTSRNPEELFHFLDTVQEFQQNIEQLRQDVCRDTTMVAIWKSMADGNVMSKEGLKYIGTDRDIEMVVKAYSSTGRDELSYQDFCQIFQPRQTIHSPIIAYEPYGQPIAYQQLTKVKKIFQMTAAFIVSLEEMKKNIWEVRNFRRQSLQEFMWQQDKTYGQKKINMILRHILKEAYRNKDCFQDQRIFYEFLLPIKGKRGKIKKYEAKEEMDLEYLRDVQRQKEIGKRRI